MADFRTQFADFGETIYLNCAYQGVFPLAAVIRGHEAIDLKCHPEKIDTDEYFNLPQRVRNHLAAIIGSDESEIALTSGATQGIGVAAAGLQFKPGDEVIVAAGNFPCNLFTWLQLRRNGIEVKVLKNEAGPLQVDDVARAFSPHTKLLALDWVDYSTGSRIDLAALGGLAHERGAVFVVDGTQGVGALDLDIHALPVDILAVAAYKWLLGPYGTGFVYVREEMLNRLDLKVVNWTTVDGADNFDSLPVDNFALPHAARIFDMPGTANFLNLSTLEPSLEFVRGVGPGSVGRHCSGLLDILGGGLQRRGYRLANHGESRIPSPILSFRSRTDDTTVRLYQQLKARHIEISMRHGWIRVSPYLYNRKEDIERLLQIAV